VDYLFAVIGRFEKMDVLKGMVLGLKIVKDLLEKFKSGSDASEVMNCILDHHSEDLNDISNSRIQKYSKASDIAHEIIAEYFTQN
jgi:hypothetical protein